MNKSIVPSDSILHHWLRALAVTEVPTSYAITIGLTAMGSLLKRQAYVDQVGWKVYPNQSVMLVGPSGIGKDTVINYAQKLITQIAPGMILGGRTMPTMYQRLHLLGNPAAAYITAKELSAFFGNQDYQSGMVQEMTDLLSTGDRVDISTKSEMGENNRPKYIQQPTLTLHCGTTEEWLHKAMPDGTMEGGFLGRFLIVVEKLGSKHVALVKWELTTGERKKILYAMDDYREAVTKVLQRYPRSTEVVLLEEARDLYTNWYHNRFKYFSKAVLPYANRSRDTVLRLAMLMGISRGHSNWVDESDVQFAIDVLQEMGRKIDNIVLPPTMEAQAAAAILELLPARTEEIFKSLGRKFETRRLNAATELLLKQGSIQKKGTTWVKTKTSTS